MGALSRAFEMTSLSYAHMGLILVLGVLIDPCVRLAYLFSASRARKCVQSEHHVSQGRKAQVRKARLQTGIGPPGF